MNITFIELSGFTRRIKKQNAKRLIKSGAYERIAPYIYKRIERSNEMQVVIYPEIPSEYPYPEWSCIPLVPANRYPVNIARRGLTSYAY